MSFKSIDIKFQILKNNDPTNIVVLDTSKWAQIENKPAIIEITLPGETEPYVEYFNKNAVNYFNSINLGVNCDNCGEHEELDLPDGVYEITVKGSPDRFYNTVHYLKTDSTNRELKSVFLKINFCNDSIDKELLEKLFNIELYIKAAEINVEFGNICEAQELFFKAQEDIKKLKNCKSCF